MPIAADAASRVTSESPPLRNVPGRQWRSPSGRSRRPLLTWVNRLTKIRRREQDLFGHWRSEWRVLRISNGYRFVDPLEREPGRRVWCKSDNPTRPQNRDLNEEGAPLIAAQVIQETPPWPPPEQTERPAIAPRREHDPAGGTLLSDTERAALIRRLDTKPTKADWRAYERDLAARLV